MIALITLGIIYALGTLIAFGVNLLDYSMAKGLAATYEGTAAEPDRSQWSRDFWSRAAQEKREEAIHSARRARQAPAWPLWALGFLAQAFADSKKEVER